MICPPATCTCAFESSTLNISNVDGVVTLEQAEFTDIADIKTDIADIQAVLATLASTYVDTAGDAMTGPLEISVGLIAAINLLQSDDNPFMAFSRLDGSRTGYIQAVGPQNFMRIAGDGNSSIRFTTDSNQDRMRIVPSTGFVLIGKSATGVGTPGCELHPNGRIVVTATSANATTIISNLTNGVASDTHVSFRRAGTIIGSITQVGTTGIAYNTTSDEELKEHIRPIDDQLAQYWARLVEPMFYEQPDDPALTHGSYIAQRVAAAWPESIALGVVSPGSGNPEDRTFDEDGVETTQGEVWEPWQLDLSKFVPYLHAAWRATDQALKVLQDRVDAQEIQIQQLSATVDALSQR